jgi:hypothetical protein
MDHVLNKASVTISLITAYFVLMVHAFVLIRHITLQINAVNLNKKINNWQRIDSFNFKL